MPRNCETCKWDSNIRCNQGHFREWAGHWIPLENCHAWKPKDQCWCEQPTVDKRLQLHDYILDQWGLGHYQMRTTENAKFCPRCGKKLDGLV